MTGMYAWLRNQGCWLAKGSHDTPPTHLLLDGGRVAVSEHLHGAFLNAYAAAVVRGGGTRPCIVELRTPVFKLFLDIDARYAEDPRDGVVDMAAPVLAAMAGAAADFFQSASAAGSAAGSAAAGSDMVVCLSSASKQESDRWKRGFHVVWPDICVTAATALRFRAFLLDRLAADVANPFDNDWDSLVDACVFKANGLRMPWSAKGRGDDSYYVPVAVVRGDGTPKPIEEPRGVSDVREHVRRLSVRTFCTDETPVLVPPDDVDIAAAAAAAGSPAAVHSGDLAPFADVLPALEAALPPQFCGQKFSGLVKGEACFMLRSTSRWCLNLDAEHRSSNVYFVLTRKGVHQRCYCRKDTTERRKYGMCQDFSSDVWPVPPEVVDAFFHDEIKHHSGGVGGGSGTQQHRAMPSQVTKRALNMDTLLDRRLQCGATRRRRKK